MGEWLKMNIATVITALLLVLALAGAVWVLVKNKKQGKSSCGCKCSSCPMSGSCHKK